MSCKKDLPELTTTEVSDIKALSASSGGCVTDDGGTMIHSRGICWGTRDHPTLADSKKYSGTGTGCFDGQLVRLNPDTYYHVRAFAANGTGIAYGNEVHFRSLSAIAKVTTTSVSSVSFTSAKATGNIKCEDESILTERGFCMEPIENPTVEMSTVTCGSGTGNYSCNVGPLQPGTLYKIRAYAKTVQGTFFGNEICCQTLKLPAVTTTVIEFTKTTAKFEGRIMWADAPVVPEEWGFFYGTEPDPTVHGNYYGFWEYWSDHQEFPYLISDEIFSFPFNNLTPGTTYYVTAFVWLVGPVVYGNEVSFMTKP